MTSPAGGRLRLATRGSPQALTQARVVADAIESSTGRATELVPTSTTGDRDQSVPLHVIGGLGVFVKEIQQAVLDGRADLAVHSAKDLPSETPEGLVIGAFCERRDPADALIGCSLADLAEGATIATGSVRRRAQLAADRPDLKFVELRGNIARRLEQVPEGGAVVMAVAALEVLGLSHRITERLDPNHFVPAVGQGCVAVECRADDVEIASVLATIDHGPTRFNVTVERAFLRELGSGCTLPVGAYCYGGQLDVFLACSDDIATTVGVIRDRVVVPGDLGEASSLSARVARQVHESIGT